MKDEGYWARKIVPKYQCADCGGAVRKDGACPVVKGSLMAYRCIRCGSSGTVEDKITWDGVRISGDIERA